MLAATAIALMLAQQPLPSIDSGIDHGSRSGLVESAPFACEPDDDVAICVPDDDDDDDL